jgi:hypothetical protein
VTLPNFVKFMLLGLFFADIIMENFAVSFKGDFHPNLVVNSFLWVGAYAGMLVAWWIVSRLYYLTPWQVFFIYGFKGIVVEQDFLVPLMIWKGKLLEALLVSPYLVVVYGVAVAPVFLILQDELPKVRRLSAWLGVGLAFSLPLLLFYFGAFIWFHLVQSLFGLRPVVAHP